jgi:glycosyltransferase involved in cell wall biosynthesis
MKLLIFPSDPLIAYVRKGELKPNYFNPGNLFDEIHFVTFPNEECLPEDIQVTLGRAAGFIHRLKPLGIGDIFFPFRRVEEVAELFESKTFDCVRAFNPTLSGFIALHYARRIGKPFVVSVHTVFDKLRQTVTSPKEVLRAVKYWLLYPHEKYVHRHADRIIGVTYESVRHASMRNARTTVIFNRIYPETFHPDPASEKTYDMIMVGRVEKPKRQELLLKALAPGRRCLIIGTGNGLEALKEMSKKSGTDVVFIDTVPNVELAQWYNRSRICVQLSDYEGFGIPVLEAMMCGLPVVCSDIPSFREIGQKSVLYVRNRPDEIRRTVESLLDDAAKMENYAQASLKRAREIEGDEMETKEAELYKEVIGG